MKISVNTNTLTHYVTIASVDVTGKRYGVIYGARLSLNGPPNIESQESFDDGNTLTFWLPDSDEEREKMAKAFEKMADVCRYAPDRRPSQMEMELDKIHTILVKKFGLRREDEQK